MKLPAVLLTGACTRDIVTPFSCEAAADDSDVSARKPVDEAHGLYLTLNVDS